MWARAAGAAVLFCVYAGLVVWTEPAMCWAVFPIKRELPNVAPYVSVPDLASEVETGAGRHNGTPFLSAKVGDLCFEWFRMIDRSKRRPLNKLKPNHIGRSEIWSIKMDQMGPIKQDVNGCFGESADKCVQNFIEHAISAKYEMLLVIPAGLILDL